MRSVYAPVALLTALVLLAPEAGAQQEPATIPTRLATALLDGALSRAGGAAASIVVGRAPDSTPSSLTAIPGAEVLGGIADGPRSVVALAFTGSRLDALDAFEKAVTAKGWTALPSRPAISGGFSSGSGGFVSGPQSELVRSYCADSASALVMSSPAPGGGSYLRVQYIPRGARSICASRARFDERERTALEFPTLVAPRGMHSDNRGSGWSSYSSSIAARLTGPVAPAATVASYAAQLKAAGWTVGSVGASGDAAAILAAEATAKDGTRWRGALTAVRVAPDTLDVELRMARPEQP